MTEKQIVRAEAMNIKKSISLLVSLFVLISCGTQKNDAVEDDGIQISLKEHSTGIIHIPDWMEPIEVVALETIDESLLTYVDKIIEYKNRYYVLDKMQKSVFVFDGEGRYLQQIGKAGNGPGEYTRLHDFSIDKETGYLYFMTGPTELFVYAEDGSFLQKKEISRSMLWNVCCHKGEIFCSSNHLTYTEGDDAFLLYRFDTSLQEKERSIRVHSAQIYSPLLISSPFIEHEDNLYYADNFFHKIHLFKEGKFSTAFKLGLDNPMPLEYFQDTNRFLENQMSFDYVMDVTFSDNYLLIGYIDSGDYHVAIYDIQINRMIANGMAKGMLPKMFSNNGMLLSPFSVENYQIIDDILGNYMDDSLAIEDNYLILKWKVKIGNKEKVLTE